MRLIAKTLSARVCGNTNDRTGADFMRLTFIGADHEVTGSCHFLEACGLNILIDCGMEQGINKYENAELPIPYSDVDYVLVTHAHIDHGIASAYLCEGIPRTDYGDARDLRSV